MLIKIISLFRYDHPVEIDIVETKNVSDLLAKSLSLFDLPSSQDYHLIYCGNVVSGKDGSISQIVTDQAEPFYLLTTPSALKGHSFEDIRTWIRLIVDPCFHYSPLSIQDDTTRPVLFSLLSTFCDYLEVRLKDNTARCFLSKDDVHVMRQCLKSIAPSAISRNGVQFVWYDAYGCVMVAHVNDYDMVSLRLLCLDQWKFEMHSSPSESMFSSKAPHSEFVTLFYRSIELREYSTFSNLLKQKLKDVNNRKGSDRTAATGKQGHQKTPAMIDALIKETLQIMVSNNLKHKIKFLPRGGFTDVGQHTGGHPRYCSWALVKVAILYLLRINGNDLLFNRFFPQMYLQISEWGIARLLEYDHSKSTSLKQMFRKEIDDVLQSLSHAVAEVHSYLPEMNVPLGSSIDALAWKYESIFFVQRSILIQHLLYVFRARIHEQISKKSLVPELDYKSFEFTRPKILLPSKFMSTEVRNNIHLFKIQARKNMKHFLSPPGKNAKWNAVLDWLDAQNGDSMNSLLLISYGVENYFFDQISNQIPIENDDVLLLITSIVHKYREKTAPLRGNQTNHDILISELESRELLVVWITYCIIHASAKERSSLLSEYSVPLNHLHLKHLVLSDKQAVHALKIVALYLHENRRGTNFIFSTLKGDDTINFASRYTQGNESMLCKWKEELEISEKREQERWKIITRKKGLLPALDNELTLRQEELEILIESHNDTFNDINYVSKRRLRFEIEQKVKNKKSIIKDLESKISSTEKVPCPIFQPLPNNKENAYPVLFFLWMPVSFQLLSEFSFIAQQLLLPNSDEYVVKIQSNSTEKDSIKSVPGPKTNWYSYYTENKTSNSYQATRMAVILGSKVECISRKSKNWYSKNVRNCHSISDGVYYPNDLCQLHQYWSGGLQEINKRPKLEYFDPFSGTELAMIHKFMDETDIQSLQWTLPQLGSLTGPVRGNEALASMDHLKLLGNLGRTQYLCFTALRAYSNLQYRKLCSVLLERNIPLEIHDLHKLVKHMLFHVGDLSVDGGVCRKWHRDENGGSNWKCLREALLKIGNESKNKPRDHGLMAICCILSAYASQWDIEFWGLSQAFSRTAMRWAEYISLCEGDNTFVEQLKENRTRKCLFYLYSLLCYGWGRMNSDSINEYLQSLVLSNYTMLFEEQSSLDDNKRRLLNVVRAQIICGFRKTEDLVLKNSNILTQAYRAIISNIAGNLEWKPMYPESSDLSLQTGSTCFEAITDDGNLCNINLISGAVLYNGLPPSRLPDSVVKSQIYHQTFGARNFEVVRTQENTLLTASKIENRLYEFSISGNDGKVMIIEIEEIDTRACRFELLPTEDDENALSAFPIRLQKLHSHWIYRERNIVLFRPHKFTDRRIEYVAFRHNSKKSDSSSEWCCFLVPDHLKSKHWNVLLQNELSRLDELILCPESLPVAVLSKFEDPNFIHCFKKSDKSYAFHLVRYGLEFRMKTSVLLESVSFSGFHVRQRQDLENTLHGFSQFLILESKCEKKLIIPAGSTKLSNGSIRISEDTNIDAKRSFHVYNIHERFQTLHSIAGKNSIQGRLQLAEIYSKLDSLLPEEHSCSTPGETSMQLLRQSWSNQRYSEIERSHLLEILRTSKHQSSLPLLCYELSKSSTQLQQRNFASDKLNFPQDAMNEYYQKKTSGMLSCRGSLTSDEEICIIGTVVPNKSKHRMKKEQKINAFCSPCHSSQNIVARLKTVAPLQERTIQCSQSYPLRASITGKSNLSRDVKNELRNSWELYHKITEKQLHQPLVYYEKDIQDMCNQAEQERRHLESKVLFQIRNIPTNTSVRMMFLLRRSIHLESIPSVRDLAICSCKPERFRDFNPFLSEEAMHRLHEMVLEWMHRCTIEDKMIRMKTFLMDGNKIEFTRELCELEREWSIKNYPYWLLFEVEQRIQIRRLQYTIAKLCINGKMSVFQLNMGEGKTRVILPMLIRHVTNSSKGILRVHVLSSLISEVYDFLHHSLTASIISQRIVLLPFSRDVQLTIENAECILHQLKRYREMKSFICIAPEHRLSMQLKETELLLSNNAENKIIAALLAKIRNLNYYDIFDESDELLHFKYQLIYAVGDCIPLPDGEVRWICSAAVLREVECNVELHQIEGWDKFMTTVTGPNSICGNFNNRRLIRGKEWEEQRQKVLRIIGEGILKNPPHQLRRLQDIKERDLFLQFITEEKKGLDWLRENLPNFNFLHSQMSTGLALRGFLAYGLLEKCLEKRHRVNYGVDERRGRLSKVAVPYRASDTPSERAEFAHPDSLIMLTHLSFYYRGMTESEMLDAVKSLLRLGPNAQRAEYSLWFEPIRDNIGKDELSSIDMVEKLDPTSKTQMCLIHKVYKRCMAAINFWLSSCIFPRETMQFASRISANAFDLADNSTGNLVGFSGTKDNRFLLPAQVEQGTTGCKYLDGTDGKMVYLIQSNNNVEILKGNKPLSHQVIDKALECEVNAIIDVGASMAELSNFDVASVICKNLVQQEPTQYLSKLKGVVFYDKHQSTWTVLTRQGQKWPLGNSPVHERECLVFFDESRCRGADMKLSQNAAALVTIGPLMCKDKLMQAAGRMRKLDRGQKLIFSIPKDLEKKIAPHLSGVTCTSLLNWVVENSINSVGDHLYEWAIQGLRYCSTKTQKNRLTSEIVHVDELYAHPILEESVNAKLNRRMKQNEQDAHICSGSTQKYGRVQEDIQKRIEKYGKDWKIMASSCEEECERELEQERELEEEVEEEGQRMLPLEEFDWDISGMDKWKTWTDLPPEARVMDMMEACEWFSSTGSANIKWNLTEIALTSNFAISVQDLEQKYVDQGDFLKPVDAMIVFDNGGCLIISDREANRILSGLWDLNVDSARNLSWCFMNFNMTFKKNPNADGYVDLEIPVRPTVRGMNVMSPYTLGGLQLFGGCTNFLNDSVIAAVEEILQTRKGKEAALLLAHCRCMSHTISRSDLEEICSKGGVSYPRTFKNA